jgi:hypothetical protein
VPSALGAAIGRLAFVQLVEQRPDILLEAGAGDTGVHLLAPDRSPISPEGLQDPAQLADALRQQFWRQRLLNAPLPRSTFNLNLALDEGTRGHRVFEGERIAFVVVSDKPAHLLLLDINAQGDMTVLYPNNPSELTPIDAHRPVIIPGSEPQQKIAVIPPFGTDYVVAYAFPKAPSILAQVMGAKLSPQVHLSEIERLEAVLTDLSQDMARATMKLLTEPRSPAF